MIKAACHCTAVRFEIAEAPKWVLDCSCTSCRRYGALWTYFIGNDPITLVTGPDRAATETYTWGDRWAATHRCRTCGCITHIITMEGDELVALNARMIPTLDPAKTPVRQIDNGHTGFFWTRSPDPPIPGRHPAMPKPGPDDWR